MEKEKSNRKKKKKAKPRQEDVPISFILLLELFPFLGASSHEWKLASSFVLFIVFADFNVTHSWEYEPTFLFVIPLIPTYRRKTCRKKKRKCEKKTKGPMSFTISFEFLPSY